MNSDNRTETFDRLISLIADMYGPAPTLLHRPVFEGNEKAYLTGCIDSNYVSSVGARVDEFERKVAEFTGARFAVATVNGTAALHIALVVAGVKSGDEVLSQALTFVATCNAIDYIGAKPVFIDVERSTLGMNPDALHDWLANNTRREGGKTYNAKTGAHISACVPMHTFGIPCRIAEIAEICAEFGIALVEDTAESLGSYVGDLHTGRHGKLSAFSFNGNKIITTGGGGMVITDDEAVAKQLKFLTTTAKRPHPYEYFHEEIGFNYRLPNLNAAVGCAQMEKLGAMIAIKAGVADKYRDFCADNGIEFMSAPAGTRPNNWLNAVVLADKEERDHLLTYGNAAGAMMRPIWRLMSELPMFQDCQNDGLEHSKWLADRVVNLPSSVPDSEFKGLEQ